MIRSGAQGCAAVREAQELREHYRAKQVGELLRAIRGYGGSEVVRLALQLLPLVFVRPGELRGARG